MLNFCDQESILSEGENERRKKEPGRESKGKSSPESQCGSVELQLGRGGGILDEKPLGSHLTVDVPVEAGRGEAVEG